MNHNFAKVRLRESDTWVKVDIVTADHRYNPEPLTDKWNNWLNLIARIVDIPAALVMRLHEESIEVYLHNTSPENPYETGEMARLGLGLYCETVIASQEPLLIPDATRSETWKDNPDVALRMISYLGYPVNWPDGKVFGTLCILDRKENRFSALTQELLSEIRKNMEDDLAYLVKDQALKESESRFRQAFELPLLGLVITSVEKGWLEVNAAWEKMIGYTRAELESLTWAQLTHPDDLQADLELFERLISGEIENYSSEKRFICKSGEEIYTIMSAACVRKPNGAVAYAVAAIQDITRRRLAEKQLEENDILLREANAAKDKFLSIIAHDLKGPFHSLLGLSEMLVDEFRTRSISETEEIAGALHKAVGHTYSLLTNLLDWSQARSGRMPFNPEIMNIRPLVEQQVRMIMSAATAKSITIRLQMQDPVNVKIDKPMVETVIRNLLSNAVKFTHPGGMIDIAAEYQGVECRISVRDNGVGIEPDNMDKLFRIDQSHITKGTSNEKGTGLGLLLCQEFIQKHGGKIWVESKPDKGSVFSFTLPAA